MEGNTDASTENNVTHDASEYPDEMEVNGYSNTGKRLKVHTYSTIQAPNTVLHDKTNQVGTH